MSLTISVPDSLRMSIEAASGGAQTVLYTALNQPTFMNIIGAFNGLAVDDARWPAKLRVLGQLVRRHEDEEEHKLFKVAKKVLGNDQLQGIAARVQDLRRERSAPKAAANVVSAQEGRRK